MTLPNEPEKQPTKAGFTPAKLVVLSAVISILGFGLCASGFTLGDHPSWRVPVGSSGFYIGILGVVIGAIWYAVTPRKR